MGRSFQADSSIETYIEQLIKSGQWHIGLVIGQLTSHRDFVVRLIRSPEPAENEVSEEEVGEAIPTERKESKSVVVRPKSVDLIDDQWVATHARQVTRMLPGGLEIIGIFALAPPTMMQAAQTKLRQVVFAVHKALSKQKICQEEVGITDRLVLQICSVSRKLISRTWDVADVKSAARPAEWRYVNSLVEKWSRLSTSISVDVTVTVPQELRTLSMHKQIQQGIQPFCKSIHRAMALVDGEVRTNDDMLDHTEAKKGKSKDKGRITQPKSDIDILVNMSDGIAIQDPKLMSVRAVLKVRGQMVGRSFVHNRASVGDAIQAVKSDLVRSLVSRCELLCDDLDLIEEDGVSVSTRSDEEKVLYNTPVRVFAHVPGMSIDFCDYMFQDERIDEVTDRLKELLDIDVTEDDLELQCEKHAEEEVWSEGAVGDDVSVYSEKSAVRTNVATYLGFALSGAIAALAGVVYMVYGHR